MSDFTGKNINFDFEYIDVTMQERIVLISPDAKRKIISEEDNKQFLELLNKINNSCLIQFPVSEFVKLLKNIEILFTCTH